MRDAIERALAAWDSTVLPVARDGRLQEAMEVLRASLTPKMTIDGVEYVEAPDTKQCTGCAFEDDPTNCTRAVRLARAALGGGCDSRKVIYIRATPDDRETAARRLLDEGVM